jgi:hypothetical protein
MEFILVAFAGLLPTGAYPVGAAGETVWPNGVSVEVQLRLSAAVGTNGEVKVSGDSRITQPVRHYPA